MCRSIFLVVMTSVVSWPGQAGPGVSLGLQWPALTHERLGHVIRLDQSEASIRVT